MASVVRGLRHNDGSPRSKAIAVVAVLMVLEATSLFFASGVHLSGLVHGRSASFDPDAAGIAEAVIGVVLAAAVVAMSRDLRRARSFGIAASAFALTGFLVGLSETASGGDKPDIAYHLTVIPLLVVGLVLLVRSNRPALLPPT